jgi:hypothetical protein
MEIHLVGAMRTGVRTDRHDEANSRFSQILLTHLKAELASPG